jgi:hypothetical protein
MRMAAAAAAATRNPFSRFEILSGFFHQTSQNSDQI